VMKCLERNEDRMSAGAMPHVAYVLLEQDRHFWNLFKDH